MLQTSARLLRLLTLLQARRFWSGRDLADELEVTERTLRRDVDKLRSLGYPVESSSGVAGGYQLSAGSRLPPLVLEDKEALAVALGLRLAAASPVRELGQPAIDALLKLEQILPVRLQKQVRTFNDAITTPISGQPAIPADRLLGLARACREVERVTFRYAALRGEGTRVVDPCGIVHVSQRWYLVAWDIERDDFRTFRVDRITSDVRSTHERAIRREVPGGDLATFVSHSVGSAAYAVQVRVVLHAAYEVMQSHISLLVGTLTPRDEQSCEFATGGNSLRSIALHLALLDCDFEVIEPPELLDELAVICRRFQATRLATDH